jgi:hypothetical protein
VTDLDRLIEDTKAYREEVARKAASEERRLREETANAYATIESLLIEAIGRSEPWAVTHGSSRYRESLFTWSRAVSPIYGWAFEFPHGRPYPENLCGIAVTLGGRVLLTPYTLPYEKWMGGCSVYSAYPPYEPWGEGGSPDLASILRAGVGGFAQKLATALVDGEQWKVPVGGAPIGHDETLPEFVRRLRPALRFPRREPSAL